MHRSVTRERKYIVIMFEWGGGVRRFEDSAYQALAIETFAVRLVAAHHKVRYELNWNKKKKKKKDCSVGVIRRNNLHLKIYPASLPTMEVK